MYVIFCIYLWYHWGLVGTAAIQASPPSDKRPRSGSVYKYVYLHLTTSLIFLYKNKSNSKTTSLFMIIIIFLLFVFSLNVRGRCEFSGFILENPLLSQLLFLPSRNHLNEMEQIIKCSLSYGPIVEGANKPNLYDHYWFCLLVI